MLKYHEHCTVADLDTAHRSLRYLQESGQKGIIVKCKVWTAANLYRYRVRAWRVLVLRALA